MFPFLFFSSVKMKLNMFSYIAVWAISIPKKLCIVMSRLRTCCWISTELLKLQILVWLASRPKIQSTWLVKQALLAIWPQRYQFFFVSSILFCYEMLDLGKQLCPFWELCYTSVIEWIFPVIYLEFSYGSSYKGGFLWFAQKRIKKKEIALAYV